MGLGIPFCQECVGTGWSKSTNMFEYATIIFLIVSAYDEQAAEVGGTWDLGHGTNSIFTKFGYTQRQFWMSINGFGLFLFAWDWD